MSSMIRRITRLRLDRGFTLIEVMVAILVLVVGFIFVAQFFTSAMARVLTSDTRSLMQQVANQELETVRALQYQDIGTVGGNPAGALSSYGESPDHHLKVVEGRSFLIVREVTYKRDDSYSPTGPYPANYRRATIKVYLYTGFSFDPTVTFEGNDFHVSSAIQPIEMSTNIAGGAQGGTIDVTVTDLSGANGIEGAQLTISDSLLVPSVLINASAIRTDTDGKMMVPGLTTDPGGGYQVRAEKSGYNPAELKQTVVVLNGTPFTVVQLICDRLATMNIHVTDQNGVPLSNVALTVTGYKSVGPFDPQGKPNFTQTVQTDATGTAVLPDIRYSTSLEPYFIQLVTPHTPPLRLPTGVDLPILDAVWSHAPLGPVPAGTIPMLLDPGETQDVYLVVDSTPVVTGLSPTGGFMSGGTTVTITGNNFTGATSVKFGGTNATSFTVNSNTQITAVSPAGTGTVHVTVTTPSGTSATSSADQYAYIPAPAVTAVSPTGGKTSSGTTVTITGNNFTGATSVNFGGTNATSFTVNSDTQITAVAPAHSKGTVDITVTTPYGTSATSSADQYTYYAVPAVTGRNITSGTRLGGTVITITGTDFTGATVVSFGGTNAATFTVVNATTITVTTPAHATGTVDITVTTPGGTSATSSADRFTYN